MEIKSADEITKINIDNFTNKISFKDLNTQITYSDLENYSNIICHELIQMGLMGQQPVVIIMERSVYYVASIYGILKCGAFFVPINADDDSNRFYSILNDIDAKYIITSDNYYNKVKSFQKRFNKHNLNVILAHSRLYPADENTVVIDYQKKLDNNIAITSTKHGNNDIAYIIYTSGSTGKPKGVSITNRNLMNFIFETVNLFGFNDSTKILSFKPFFFSGAMTDIFCGPYIGGTVFIENQHTLPRKIVNAIKEVEATHISIAPSLIHLLAISSVFSGYGFQHVKTFSFGADVVQSEDIIRLKNKLPHVRFFNRYGSSETTVAVSAYEVKSVCENEKIPIGKPLNNNNFYVLTDEYKIANSGEIGELFIGGVQVMKGYWKDEELTNTVLREDIIPGELLYKTGDLVYQTSEGNYIFYGRKDFTINKHGYRINLNEVEKALLKTGDVRQCVCVSFCENNLTKIAAFIIYANSKDMTDIRRDIAKYLPYYMVPDTVILVDDIPYTLSGKPDRSLLYQKYIGSTEKV